ncbi:MAG: DUF664 domain-containing protein [Saprospiraceae bacterium]|nr:DUF664 domain-containing protein [Saprospiraceae bacterium]
MRILIMLVLCGLLPVVTQLNAQVMEKDSLPFSNIQEYPDDYSSNLIAARMVDALGFRYQWATEGLRPEDLAYQPSADGRTCMQTIDHILGLSNMIHNAISQRPNQRNGQAKGQKDFQVKRQETLDNLAEASQLLKNGGADVSKYKIIFQRGDRTNEFPFWNLINGPVADAIWHVGQVVSFRRASGNPWNSKVSVFSGTVRK